MKSILVLFINVALTTICLSQSYTISGTITDLETGEQLIAANVFDEVSSSGTISNNFGFYSVSLPAGKVVLNFSYIGYNGQTIEIDLNKDTKLDVNLSSSVSLETVEITAETSRRIAEETQMSTVDVPILQIKKIPPLLGETDVLKALQLLPGVQSGGEGQSGFYVRGGSPDQNLILLDGVPVYNASHLFGFFSVFNADAIKDVKLIKGGFPARYGGRLSSVLEINLKEGNAKEFKGQGSIGLVASKLTLEGPIDDKTSFMVSGRRTYIDVLARPFIQAELRESGLTGGTGYFFHDINAKINRKLSDKDKLYASFYTGLDKFYFDEKDNEGDQRDFTENSLGWGNQTAALRWNRIWQPKLFSNATLTFSNYGLKTAAAYGTEYVADEEMEEISIEYVSGIRDIALKLDFDYLPKPEHFIRFGISGIHHRFDPGSFDLMETITSENYNFSINVGQDVIKAGEYALYIEDDWKVNDKLKVNVGLHSSAFAVNKKFYASLQPRVSGRYLLDESLSAKLSFSTMRQYIHLLAFDGIGLPTDLWLPTTEIVKPQQSYQLAAGIAKQLGDDYELTIEAYYKHMDNLISFKEGSGLFEFSDWQTRITQGQGKSYGTELFLQKRQGDFTGWIGYTLSWTNRQFDDLNFGNTYPYRYDRRHDISVVGQYQLSDRINISGTWVYGTGNAVTLGNAQFISTTFNDPGLSNNIFNYYESRNNYRMRAYHRFDIGINFTKKKKRHTRTWSIGAYNTYNRKNPFFVFTDSEWNEDTQTSETVLKQASLFPLIPYFNYAFEF